MKKRGFALLLAVVLCVGSVSASVLAKAEDREEGETEDESIPEAEPEPEEEPGREARQEPEAEPAPGTEAEVKEEPAMETEPEPEAEPQSEEEADPEDETAKEPVPAKERAGGILPRMTGAGDEPFPVDDIDQLSVVWKDALEQTVYSWKKDRDSSNDGQSTIDGLYSGEYTVYVSFREAGMPPRLENGKTYTLQLDWPAGDNVTVRIKGNNSGTAQDEDDKNIDLFDWEVSDTGLLSITILNRKDTLEGELHFTASVSKTGGEYPDGDPNPADPSVVKEGRLDEAISDVITWKFTAVIPRCGDSHSGVSAWSLSDDIGQSSEHYGEVKNDLSLVQAALVSTEYPGGIPVPSIEKAGEEDTFAYRIEEKDDVYSTVYLLNRCTCEEGDCANWSDGCGCKYKDTGFCSCWHSIYNAEFTFTYSTDISKILQALVDENTTLPVKITNNIALYENADYVTGDQDAESVRRPFVKKETGRPDDRDGIGQYEITFDPHGEDYSWADSITITDELENLALRADSLVVQAGETRLQPVSEEKAYDLDPEADRDRFYSLAQKDVTDPEGKKTGETVTITLWYPTDQGCTVSYEAAVLSYADEPEGTYSNTVRIGSVQYRLAGSYREGHSGESGSGSAYTMTLTKVDAEEPERALPGAVFEIYRYAVEEGYEEDWLLATETTGEDGTFTFHSDLSKGFVLEEDVLYYLREVRAPEGYQRTDTLAGFIFEAEGYTGSLPEGLEWENVTIGTPGAEGGVHIALTETNQKDTKITRDVTGIKTWEDQENAEGLRPESITVRLHADGEEVDSRVVTAEEDWTWSFTGLDFYDGDGRVICYTITEDPVPGYETLYHDEDYGVTNRRWAPEKGVDTRGDGAFENDGEEVHPGDTLTYQIRFYNYRDAEADVIITDPLDDALDFVSASDDGIYEEETHTITWMIPSVPARTWGEVTFTAAVNELAVEEGEAKNTALIQIGNDQAFETNTVRNPVPKSPEEAPEALGGKGPGVKTGDSGNIGLWAALMAAGLAGLLAVLGRRKKTGK